MTAHATAPIEILPHPEVEDAKILMYESVREMVSPDEPLVKYIGSDSSEDRYGSVIDSKGWETEDYMRSGAGVFLWAHQYSIPSIGKTVELERKGNKLMFYVRYAVEEFDFARTIFALVKGGYISAVSVGFIPKKWEDYESETLGDGYFAENRKYLQQELLELSQVTVPANRNAIKNAIQKGVIAENEVRFGLDQYIFRDLIEINRRAASQVRKETGGSIISPNDPIAVKAWNKVKGIEDPEIRKIAFEKVIKEFEEQTMKTNKREEAPKEAPVEEPVETPAAPVEEPVEAPTEKPVEVPAPSKVTIEETEEEETKGADFQQGVGRAMELLDRVAELDTDDAEIEAELVRVIDEASALIQYGIELVAGTTEIRKGASISKRNRSLLKEAADRINQVLSEEDSAEEVSEEGLGDSEIRSWLEGLDGTPGDVGSTGESRDVTDTADDSADPKPDSYHEQVMTS